MKKLFMFNQDGGNVGGGNADETTKEVSANETQGGADVTTAQNSEATSNEAGVTEEAPAISETPATEEAPATQEGEATDAKAE